MKKNLLTLLFFFLVALVSAQTKTITGKVTEAATGDPIPGVSIVVQGTTSGTITDIDGNYSVQAAPSDTLLFSFVGMTTEKMAVGNNSTINVALKESTEMVDEVVVVGYGQMNVKDLTSSIATVKADELEKTPTGSPMQALQGKVAGMQVVSSGAPGSAPTIRVRGIGSYPGNNSESPLYVVDGMFFDNIDFLNTQDIASISVLKDASAAAIYGVRAANGVVLIETKSGSLNQEAQITYNGYFGYQVAQNVLKMANAEQFTNMALESGSQADREYILNAMQRYGRSRINPNVPDVNTDWYNEILRPAAIQNHSINVSGGTEKAAYAVGTNYFFQEGILDMKNQYERFNLRSNIDYHATDWLTIGGNVIFSNGMQYLQQDAAWFTAYYAIPIMPVMDPQNTDAWPVQYASAEDLGYRGAKNPFPVMDFNNDQQKTRKTLSNFYVELSLIPDMLTFKTTYNHAFTSLYRRTVDFPYFISNNSQREVAGITKRTEIISDQIWDNILTFDQDFGKHSIVVMGGVSYRDESWQMLTARGEEYTSIDREESWYIDQAQTINVDAVSDDGSRQYGFSYLGRLSYNYDDRYLLYGTMRADGSSKYQEKWGYFPTIGVGWVLSGEDFFNVNLIEFLKLRASWGQLGNDKIPASDGARTTTVLTTAINDELRTGTVASSSFAYLEWELTEETNVGLTARMFDSRLSADLDYYVRDTKNAAINVTLPLIGNTIRRNVGIIRNTGFELALNWANQVSQDLSYNVGVNFSTLKNEVRDLYGQPYIDGGSAEFRQRSIVGEPLLAFYGYHAVGVYQTPEEIQNDPIAVANNLQPGDLIYEDVNNDNAIDDKDRMVLGSYFPNFMYGANLGINWRSFSFTANVMGQTGVKILNRKRGEIIWTPDGNMDADLAINRWHGQGTSNIYPSSAGLRKGWNQKLSNYFVEDGSFFRIQNVVLAYKIKGDQLFGDNFPDARISLTAERPLTIFSYNGFNPEVSDGIDRQTYPVPAVYTVGLNINF